MTWHAIDDIGDAIDATKALLVPFDWWVWLRLGVVVALLGGVGGGIGQLSNVSQFGGSTGVEGLLAPVGAGPSTAAALAQLEPGGLDPGVMGAGMIFVVALVLLGLLAILLLASIGTTMEFVLVQTLRRERVSVGADFGGNYVSGIRLAIFRFGLWALAALVVGGVALAMLGTDPATWTDRTVLNALLGLAVVAIPLFLVVAVVNGFTTVFVVPIMLVEDRSVLSAWRRLLGSIAGNVGQYLLYLVVSVLLGIGVSIVLGFAIVLALIAVGIPTALLTLALWVVLSGPLLWVLGGAVVFLGIVALAVAGLYVSVPLVVFQRYFALFVLGDVEPSVDPIPEVRAAVRAEEPTPGA